jgi:hypothetical protein
VIALHRLAFLLACGVALSLSPACATVSPTKAKTLAVTAVADIGAQYRAINAGFIDGCVSHAFPVTVCKPWADFSAEFVQAFDPAADVVLEGTDPAGPQWAALVQRLVDFGAQFVSLAMRADGGAP